MLSPLLRQKRKIQPARRRSLKTDVYSHPICMVFGKHHWHDSYLSVFEPPRCVATMRYLRREREQFGGALTSNVWIRLDCFCYRLVCNSENCNRSLSVLQSRLVHDCCRGGNRLWLYHEELKLIRVFIVQTTRQNKQQDDLRCMIMENDMGQMVSVSL